MSTLSSKRRKLSNCKEFECSEGSDALDKENESKLEQGTGEEEKSDAHDSADSQENQSSSRAAGLVRRRKKKVFADYYYGDDIFSKPKNGNKKKTGETKPKKVKKKAKAKTYKKEKTDDVNKNSSKFNKKEDGSQQSNKICLNSELINLANSIQSKNANPAVSGYVIDQKLFNSLSFYKEGNDIKNNTMNKVVPIKPIPQRHPSSNIDHLLNAYRLSNPTKIKPNQDESLKKREDKAFDKSLHEILSNSEVPLMSRSSSIGDKTMKNALTALLNNSKAANNMNFAPNSSGALQYLSEGRKSSSEMENNSKHITPTKPKTKRIYHNEDYMSSQEKYRKNSLFSGKKSPSNMLKTPSKFKSRKNFGREEIRVSRVKKTVREGDAVKLLLDNDTSSKPEECIKLNVGDKNLFNSLSNQTDAPNLNKCFGITSSINAIMNKIKNVLTSKYSKSSNELIHSRVIYDPEDQRINSLPLLFAHKLG
jgi:hypothetical protein